MSKSIAKNLMYNLILQITTLLIPLITVPYISRILGKEGIGLYSYTLSITQYFIILGTLGISLYGNRQIAYVRDDKEKMSKSFWSIIFLKIFTTCISLIVYIVVFGFKKEYSVIYLIQAMNIISAMIDISWLYMGLEDFKKTVTRNLIVKLLGVICIFAFVKNYDDLYLYITINGLMMLLGNLVMWLYLPKTIIKVKIALIDIREHILPALKLFIPQIAIQIYAVLDKSMLGYLSNTGEVGLYDQSQKIIMVVLSLVTSLGVVMLPRMSNTFANGDNEMMDNYLNKSLCAVTYVSIPMSVGLAAISKEFVPWFFGPDFKQVTYLMIVLSPILFLISISNVLGIQYLLPANRTKEYTASVTIGAIINIILNLILISKYKAIGACIASVCAEFSVTLIQYLCLRKNILRRQLVTNIMKYLIASAVMLVFVRTLASYMDTRIVTTIVQGMLGSITYVLILSLFKDKTNSIIFKTIKSKLFARINLNI